ncbi:Transcription factor IIIC putative zinc-finger domain-containing protein [Plasmodiophora brassicae]|uniref:Transcription factor IIIC putative zinc-finger domain-containing protein n=1 Tax=Plasmodiophora brassicae TaxID=37360 RepID=A0A3P3YCP9_PLABS|nr:unnamed protein product [Plasmodiophora brassicae]
MAMSSTMDTGGGPPSPSLVALLSQQSPSLTFSSSLSLSCFNTSAIFSTHGPTSPFSIGKHPPSAFDCLLDNSSPGVLDEPPPMAPLPRPLTLSGRAVHAPTAAPSPFKVGSGATLTDDIASGLEPIATLSIRPALHDAVHWSADNHIAVVGALDIDIVDVSAGESSMVKIPLAKPMTSNQVLSVPVAIKSARWSGLGCGRDGGCVLGVVVSDGRALLFSQAPVPPARWTLSENVSDTLGLNDVEALDWSPSVSDLFALGLTRGSVMLLRRQRDATLAKLASVDTPRPVSDMRFSATRLAVVTSDCTVHVYNVINEGTNLCPGLLIRPLSPLSVITQLRWSHDSTKLACAMGSAIVVTDFSDPAGASSTPLTAHDQPGMISGMIWSASSTTLTTVSTTGPAIRTWSVHDKQLELVPDAPISACDNLATRSLLPYCDDDDDANIYLRGHAGLGSSPDGLLGAVLAPIISNAAVGRSGKATSRPDLVFGLFLVPVERDPLSAITSRSVYLDNARRAIAACSSDAFERIACELEACRSDMSGLRTANVVRWALSHGSCLDGETRIRHSTQIAANLDTLTRLYASRVVACFVAKPSAEAQAAVRIAARFCNDTELVGKANELLERDDSLVETCPVCRTEVATSSLVQECCEKGHIAERCSLTLRLLDTPAGRSCALCSRRYVSDVGPAWASLHPHGPTMCPICNVHTKSL